MYGPRRRARRRVTRTWSAPPTFAVTFTIPLMEAFLRDPAVGWDYAHMVHGEQSFILHRPLYAGDEVVTTLHVDELRTARGEPVPHVAGRGGGRRGRAVLTAVSLMVTAAPARGAGVTAAARRARATRSRPLSLRVTRADLVRYAGASGDFNPIHWNERFAVGVGLPNVIAHGMLTMALAGRLVTHWIGDPAAVVGYAARFTRPVVVPDDDEGVTLEVTGTVKAVDDEGDEPASPPSRSRPRWTGRRCWPAPPPASVSPPDSPTRSSRRRYFASASSAPIRSTPVRRSSSARA